MASQPIDEGGQSPGAPEMLGAPIICKYFFFCWHTAHKILTSAIHTANLGFYSTTIQYDTIQFLFYFTAAFDPTPTFAGAYIMTIRFLFLCVLITGNFAV